MSYSTILFLRDVYRNDGLAAAVVAARAYGINDPAEFVAFVLRPL